MSNLLCLQLAGILLDTANLRDPRCSSKDKYMAKGSHNVTKVRWGQGQGDVRVDLKLGAVCDTIRTMSDTRRYCDDIGITKFRSRQRWWCKALVWVMG